VKKLVAARRLSMKSYLAAGNEKAAAIKNMALIWRRNGENSVEKRQPEAAAAKSNGGRRLKARNGCIDGNIYRATAKMKMAAVGKLCR
jgi:hypothetical protein